MVCVQLGAVTQPLLYVHVAQRRIVVLTMYGMVTHLTQYPLGGIAPAVIIQIDVQMVSVSLVPEYVGEEPMVTVHKVVSSILVPVMLVPHIHVCLLQGAKYAVMGVWIIAFIATPET